MLKMSIKLFIAFVGYFSIMLFIIGCILHWVNASDEVMQSFNGCVTFFIGLYVIFFISLGFILLFVWIVDDDWKDLFFD